jgi:hypothetical protein
MSDLSTGCEFCLLSQLVIDAIVDRSLRGAPPMRVSPTLLDTMQVTEIRMSYVARQQAEACKYGSIRYRLRESQSTRSSDEALSRIGDTVIGSLMLSCVIERFGMDIAFPEGHPYSFCIMSVLTGLYTTGRSDRKAEPRPGLAIYCLLKPNPGHRR